MGNTTVTGASSRRRPAAILAALLLFAACGEVPTDPTELIGTAPAFDHEVGHQSYESGSDVDTWDPIVLPAALGLPAACVQVPAVGLGADWRNQHAAYDFGLDFAVFQATVRNKFGWQAPWINAWNSDQSSTAPGDSPLHDENWTRYATEVEGDGDFVLRLSADNCSWIYLDGTLVATQFKDPRDSDAPNPEFGVTLSGTHTLEFIVFDGGGQAGGMFEMETTSNPPPPLNEDLDDDGHDNDVDAFPLDPTEWADTDGDGTGDNADAFDDDPTETTDSDGDGTGDNADAFDDDPTETADSDGDGVGDNADAFDDDPSETTDSDGDGVGDNADAFDDDPTETIDSDGDGVGDNADAFDNDPTETTDSDGDGVGDNADAFDDDPTETVDSDGDGVGDNADAFDDDPTETTDSDGDGIGDNADAFDASSKATSLVIGSCDSGVGNRHFGNGTWFADLVGAAQASAANHGQFVSAVAALADQWKKAGLITGRQQGAIVSCAARSK